MIIAVAMFIVQHIVPLAKLYPNYDRYHFVLRFLQTWQHWSTHKGRYWTT